MAKFLCQGLPDKQTNWSKWHVFFCDERHVPFDDPECTYNIYKRDLMSKVDLPKENIYPDNPDISGKYTIRDPTLPVFSIILYIFFKFQYFYI